jgi:NADP-dependent 3-hydroxy acid dehydrogenase YdfG
MSADGRVVVLAGASSASGTAVAQALAASGARVVAVARSVERLDSLVTAVPSSVPLAADLSSLPAVTELSATIHDRVGPVDGVVNLVGGWRGGHGITGQSDEDWDFLSGSLSALRNLSRVFYEDLAASSAGRLAIISSDVVEKPTAGSANYAALKAAAETWTRAVAASFGADGTAAATTFVVNALAGLEDELGRHVVSLWHASAVDLNGARIHL